MITLDRRHRRWPVVVVLLVVITLVVGALGWRVADTADTEDAPAVGTGPTGAAFYEPSEARVASGEHGSVIWSRSLGTRASGATTHLVLYRSTSAKGETVPVSGVVTVPDGEPPPGGWPVIAWGHGTTGMADECAPSRTLLEDGAGGAGSRTLGPSAAMVADGYAVVSTDYEGLGTPGPHPYLMGQSAGAAMADLVLAAGEITPDLSEDWVAVGHSQGGQAALFTSRFTGAYTPGLRLRGIVALAPPSQLGFVVEMLGRPEQTAPGQGATASTTSTSVFLGPMLVSAARTAEGVSVEDVVSARGQGIVPHLESRCLPGLSRDDSLGGMELRDFVSAGADLSRVRRTVGTNDAAELHPHVPVLLVQGSEDSAVPKLLTDRLAKQLEDRGADVEYLTLPGEGHISMLDAGRAEVTTWVREAFAG